MEVFTYKSRMSGMVDSSVASEVLPVEEVKLYNTFDDMDLPEAVLRGVYGNGFEKPSPIQQKGIMPIKEGRDILAQAQSGTGKTGTFTIGSLCRVDPALRKVQVLVLAPVRELAQQIEKEVKAFSRPPIAATRFEKSPDLTVLVPLNIMCSST